MHNFLREAAHSQPARQTEWQTNRPGRITYALAELTDNILASESVDYGCD